MTKHFSQRFLIAVMAIVLTAITSITAVAEQHKVLYVTHEPGTYHKYTPQLALFRDVIAKQAGWELDVITGTHEGVIKKLRTKDFAKGYDVVVYNFCFAKSEDLESCNNVMAQTRENGVPAVLIHCAMHCWWGTYKSGEAGALGDAYTGQAKAKPALVKAWREKHGDAPFPAWGDFTGIASERHGPKQPIVLHKVVSNPMTARLPEGFTTVKSELYNNVYQIEGVEPLIEGVQGKSKATIMWRCPQGKSQVVAISLGHSTEEFEKVEFQNLITDTINHLATDSK